MNNAEEFLETGRTELSLPVAHFIEPVINGFLTLLQESDDYLSAWSINIGKRVDQNGNPDPDDGLIRRNGGPYDKKSFFHFRPLLPHFLAHHEVNMEGYAEWLKSCRKLYDACFAHTQAFNLELDKYVPKCGLKCRIMEQGAREMSVLRLLCYDRTGADPSEPEKVAKFHVDRDLTTLHVAESHPGMKLGDESTPWKASENHALAFAGNKFQSLMERFYPERNFRALPHGVVVDDTSRNRWSVVFFSHILLP